MKRTVMILALLLICSTAWATGPRFQVAYSGVYTAGEDNRSTVYSFRTGASYKIWTMDNGGALYTVALGEYGDNEYTKAKGAGVEVVYFPVAPTGKGLKIFLPLGTNVTNIEDFSELSNITYWQMASGIGLYWDFQPQTAVWVAVKAQMSEDLTVVNVAAGLSIATW